MSDTVDFHAETLDTSCFYTNLARFSVLVVDSLLSSRTIPEIPLVVLRINFLIERKPLATFSLATSSLTTLLLVSDGDGDQRKGRMVVRKMQFFSIPCRVLCDSRNQQSVLFVTYHWSNASSFSRKRPLYSRCIFLTISQLKHVFWNRSACLYSSSLSSNNFTICKLPQ